MLDIVKEKLVKFLKSHHAGHVMEKKVPLKKKLGLYNVHLIRRRLAWQIERSEANMSLLYLNFLILQKLTVLFAIIKLRNA